MPNSSGGQGAPKYIKQMFTESEALAIIGNDNGTFFNGEWCEEEGETEVDGGIDGSKGEGSNSKLALSATATEFRPSSSPVLVEGGGGGLLTTSGKVSYAAAAQKCNPVVTTTVPIITPVAIVATIAATTTA